MIEARLAEQLEPLRQAYEGRAIPAVFVPGAIGSEAAALLRDAVDRAPRERFDLAHHGRFEHTGEVRDPDLEGRLAALAEHFVRAPLRLVSSRWMVLAHGDYALRRADDPPAEVIELTLDVSPRASGEANLVYAKEGGAIVFAAPQEPGGLAIVERVPGVRRYERYLTHRVGDLRITRLRLRFSRG